MNLQGIGTKLSNFLKEVRLEVRKINWPTRKETIKFTLVVLGFSTAVAILLGGLDFIFSAILRLIIIR